MICEAREAGLCYRCSMKETCPSADIVPMRILIVTSLMSIIMFASLCVMIYYLLGFLAAI